jgi:hypothetical protein
MDSGVGGLGITELWRQGKVPAVMLHTPAMPDQQRPATGAGRNRLYHLYCRWMSEMSSEDKCAFKEYA